MDEWKVDEHGKRYRETAPGHREYEMTITLSGGIEIPVSQLDEYHRRQKEAEEKRRQAALEEMEGDLVLISNVGFFRSLAMKGSLFLAPLPGFRGFLINEEIVGKAKAN